MSPGQKQSRRGKALPKPPVDDRPFRDQLRDLISTHIVPLAMRKTLLADFTELRKLPPIPGGKLPQIVKDKRELYAKFLSLIMAGVSRPVAARICDMTPVDLCRWI